MSQRAPRAIMLGSGGQIEAVVRLTRLFLSTASCPRLSRPIMQRLTAACIVLYGMCCWRFMIPLDRSFRHRKSSTIHTVVTGMLWPRFHCFQQQERFSQRLTRDRALPHSLIVPARRRLRYAISIKDDILFTQTALLLFRPVSLRIR